MIFRVTIRKIKNGAFSTEAAVRGTKDDVNAYLEVNMANDEQALIEYENDEKETGFLWVYKAQAFWNASRDKIEFHMTHMWTLKFAN